MKKILLLMIIFVFSAEVSPAAATDIHAASLYEYYAEAAMPELEKETGEMGGRLKQKFSQENIYNNQRKIDFATYVINLKKAVLYGTKLARYSDYKQDLDFARDNEVFKGLPENSQDLAAARAINARREFTQEKYLRTKINVEEEIDIYLDLLTQALDICETMTTNDLSGFSELEENRRIVKKWLSGEQFSAYQDKTADLGRAWPEINLRINEQCELWRDRLETPESPIINAGLVDAL
ncbi:MAG: hypothetical protein JXR89_04625 [Deltaproteobacteria bacterium]|nr:hypothetical protein [Deltaproteobacteria bacterium]